MKRIKFLDKPGDAKRLDSLEKLFEKAPGVKAGFASRLGYNSTGAISAWFVTGNIPHYRRPDVDAYLKGA